MYVDNKFSEPSILKNTGHGNFSIKNFDNFRFVKVTSYLAVGEHLTAKYDVDEAISSSVDQQTLLRLDPNEDIKLDEQDFIFLSSTSTTSKAIIEIPTKF